LFIFIISVIYLFLFLIFLAVRYGLSEAVEFVELPRRGFLVPGMVDTHYHAPQFVNAGNGLDMPLLEWLETYTFPAETRFKDVDYAARGAQIVRCRVSCVVCRVVWHAC